MFMRKHYDVLVVDDHKDVLEITKVALRGVRYGGLPLRLHLCESAEAARRVLGGQSFLPAVALALVDVVMETDEAGLELCEYIRGKQGNHITQVIVRTGQAARFRQTDVIERYDISGFVNKSDATDLWMITAVKTSLRQYDWACNAALFYQLYNTLILGFRSPDDLCKSVDSFIRKVFIDDAAMAEAFDPSIQIAIGDRHVTTGVFSDPFHLDMARDNLAAAPEKLLNVQGDSYREAKNDRGSLDVSLTLGRNSDKLPDVRVMARLHVAPPAYAVHMWVKLLYAIRRLGLVSEYVQDLTFDSRLERMGSWELDGKAENEGL